HLFPNFIRLRFCELTRDSEYGDIRKIARDYLDRVRTDQFLCNPGHG
ncbi:MAG: hypothetical protein GY946_16890, partial [bacterium]|nr:hypothetical protein [bacterium]